MASQNWNTSEGARVGGGDDATSSYVQGLVQINLSETPPNMHLEAQHWAAKHIKQSGRL